LKPSATLQITALAESMKKEGKDVIVLAAGQPDFPTPDYIKKAGIEAINTNQTRYTPVPGTVEFKKAIQNKFRRDNNLDYAPEEITVGTGGKQVLFNAVQVLVGPGDDAIIPLPYWVSYPPMVSIAGGNAVYLDCTLEDGFCINPDKLRKAITPRTRMLFLNSPCNPTGAVIPRDILMEIGKICRDKGVLFHTDGVQGLGKMPVDVGVLGVHAPAERRHGLERVVRPGHGDHHAPDALERIVHCSLPGRCRSDRVTAA